MIPKRYILIVIILLILTPVVRAIGSGDSLSSRPRKFFLAFNAQQGGLLNTHETEIIKNYYVGFDIRAGWQTDDSDRNIYDRMFRFPYYGFGYYMGNMNNIILGNDDQPGFGRPAALYAFFGSPIFRSKSFNIHYDLSLGFSYNFNAYDPEKTPYNILLGSKRNAYINIRFDMTYSLPKHSTFGLGFSFQHFSNGSFQKPNKGINLVSANATYQFGFYKNRDKGYEYFPVDDYSPSLEMYIFLGNGVRMLDTGFDINKPKEGRRWYCTTLSTAVMVRTTQRRKFGLGVDFFYFDWGRHVIEYRARIDGNTKTTNAWDNMSLGLFLGHEVGYKRIWLITDLGFYITPRVGDDPMNPWIYERVGLKLQVSKRLFVGFTIKAHKAKADYTEWIVGYSLVKDKQLKFGKKPGA